MNTNIPAHKDLTQIKTEIENERCKELKRRIDIGLGANEDRAKFATRILLNLDYSTVTPQMIRQLANEGADVNAMMEAPLSAEKYRNPLLNALRAQNEAAYETLLSLGANLKLLSALQQPTQQATNQPTIKQANFCAEQRSQLVQNALSNRR